MENKNKNGENQNFKININNKKVILIVSIFALIIIITTIVVSYELKKKTISDYVALPINLYDYYEKGNKKATYENNVDISFQFKEYRTAYKLGSSEQVVSSDYKHILLKYYIHAKNNIELNKDKAFVLKNANDEEILPIRKLTEPFDVDNNISLTKDSSCQITYVFEVPIDKKISGEYRLYVNLRIAGTENLGEDVEGSGYFQIKVEG